MSDTTGVKVNITADTSGYQDPIDRATVTSADFAAALKAAGNDLRKITTDMLGTSGSYDGLANAILKASNASQQATVAFNGFSYSGLAVNKSLMSAAGSAEFFLSKLNPTPLQSLRKLMAEDVPAGGKAMWKTLQENIDAANGLDRALYSAADSARVFQQALDPTPLQRMRTLMADEVPAAAHGSIGAMSGITRELIVLGHEGMVGNWTRIPGSLLVLTEYAGGLRTALGNMITSFTLLQGVGVVSVLAVAAAFVTMAVRAHEAAVAINEATNAAVMQGRSPGEARAQMKSYGDQMRDTGIMGETAMARVSSSISQLGELTAAQKDKLAAIGTPLFLAWNSDAKKTGENLAGIFSSTSAMESYLQKEHLLSEAQLTAWSQASTAKDKYDIGLQALTARFAPLTAEIKKAGEEARANQAMMFAAAETPGATMNLTGALTTPSHLGDFEGGGKQADPGAMADTEAVIEGNKHLQEKLGLQSRLEAQQRDLARATQEGNQAEIAMANSAIANTQNQIAMWHAAGDTTWEAAQQGALNTILTRLAATATSSKQLAMDENAARIAFWAQAEKNADGVESRITTARANGARARLALSGEELRGNEAGQAGWMAKQQAALSEQLVAVAASAKSSKALAEDENRTRIKFWDDLIKAGGLTEKELTAARAEGNRARLALSGEELRGGESAAKQALAAKLATLSEEQAANHDNFAKVMEIEAQKVALLRAAGANETKQLEEELTKQDNLRRQHQQQVIQQAEQALSSEQRLHTQEIAERKAELDMEVSERNISKNQEMQILRGFAAEKHALDIADAESVLATIDQQLPAYKALYDKILVMKRQFSVEDRKLNAEGAADLKRQWDAATAPVSSAIDGQIGAVMRGTTTIGQAFASMLGNIVVGYAEMGVKAAMHWASSQLMQLVLHRSTELAKTASSAAGAAARDTITTGETAAENAGLLVRIGRWIATQFGETAATTTGATTRATVLTAEQTASAEATALTARLSIAAAAAVAAAWAFADSAEAGIPGLIAAPGVSAGAYATVMAYQAAVPGLAVGAWDVPQDMLANIHAGEMVVPANFASGMRGSLAGGASGGDTNLHYSPQVSGGNQDMAGMMRAQAGAFKSYLWHATRNGALKLPGR